MTAQHPRRAGPGGYRTHRPPVGERADFTPPWPAVVGAFVPFALGLLAIITGGGALLSEFIAVNVLLLASALYAKPTADQAPGCRAVTAGPAW